MRLLFTIGLTTFVFLSASSQTSIAIKGGFNYSTARAYFNNEKQSTEFVPGANLAIQLKTAFDGPLHFSPYIAYSSRGFIIKSGNTTGDKTRNFIHYIDIAPLLSLDFVTGKKNSFIISAGPLAGLAIGGTEKKTSAGVTSSTKMHFTTSTDYGLFDFGLHTSVGYHFNKLFIEFAYQYGFANINNNEEVDKRNIRNRTYSLTLGYHIKFYQ